MEGTENSDTDKTVSLSSGPDSTEMRDVNSHIGVMNMKLQTLQDTLKTCLLELKKLCIREAELTGCLSSDCPLLPGEKTPQIRRRVGAAFKLEETSVLHGSELSSVEVTLALQQQIYVASRRLCQEKHLSRAVKRSRLQQLRREERKLKDLQENMFKLQLERSRSSPRRRLTAKSGSLSDSAAFDEEDLMSQSSEPPVPAVDHQPPPLSWSHAAAHTPTGPSCRPPENPPYQTPPQSPEDPHFSRSPALDHDSAPIQNSPWMETSLDRPQSSRTRYSCSPAVTPTCVLPTHAALQRMQSCSAPSTPDTHLRRRQSLRVSNTDPSYECLRAPRRHLTEPALTSPDYSPIRLNVYNSSSEDSSSEHSVQSYASSPSQENPGGLLWSNQNQPVYHSHVSQRCSAASLYISDQRWSSAGFSRSYVENGSGCLLDLDTRRSYISHQVPSPVHYWSCYREAPPLQQRGYRVLPAHKRLSRAPSLWDYPQHPTRVQLLSEELESWHYCRQCRQTTLHFQNPSGQSLLSSPRLHRLQEQRVNDCYTQTSVINRQKMY